MEKKIKNIRLIFLRHGEAESSVSNDIERHLTKKGILQAELAGKYLKEIQPSIPVICSHAKRTKETLANLNASWTPESIVYTTELYGAKYFNIIDLLINKVVGSEAMIIGHNPGISEIVSYFTDQNIHLGPCDLYCVDFEIDEIHLISKGTGSISFHYHPSVPL